ELVLSPDGTHALISDGRSSLTVWDTASGQVDHALEGRDLRGVGFVGLSRDGASMFAGGFGWAGIWNAQTGRRVNSFEVGDDRARFIAISPDGTRALSAEPTLTLWDLASGQPIRDLVGLAHQVASIAVSPDGARVLSGGAGGVVGLWD